jgi:hypothetical protein
MLHVELRHLELRPDRVDDAHAQIDRVADGLLLVVVIRERNRRVTVSDRDAAAVPDFLQRAGELLRGGGNREHERACKREHQRE